MGLTLKTVGDKVTVMGKYGRKVSGSVGLDSEC